MDISRLKYFHAVITTGSITGASRQLHVSQPSVSKAIKLLEEEYGVKIFSRGRRGVTLTAIGHEIAESCRSIFSELDEIENKVAGYKSVCRGILPIGASDNLCNYIMPKLLTEFLHQHPAVNTRLFSGTSEAIQQELLANRVELGIFYTPVHSLEVFDVWKIGTVPFVLIAPAGIQRFDRAHFQEKMIYVGSRREDYKKAYPALKMHQVLGLTPTRFIETNSQETQKKLVMEGTGYTIVPRHVAIQEIQSGLVAEVRLPAGVKLESPVYLVKRRSRNLDRPAAVFREYLIKKKPYSLTFR